ncbi:hypothetical protein [Leifsonia sp. NPDC080035]|uniref:Uncharacterized protein n=1 Tax=Leifsonia sp. NPDC080035 TaxID=3143936 RepID=A0AAU7G981_9MICO
MQVSRDAIARRIIDEIGADGPDAIGSTMLGAIVTGVALAVGEDDVKYLGAALRRSEQVLSVHVGVFTAGTIVTVEAMLSTQSGQSDVITRVHRRTDLERLEVAGGTPSFQADDLAEWPGRFTVRAVYRDGLELVIPMSEADTPQKRNSVWTILNGLREDLGGGR